MSAVLDAHAPSTSSDAKDPHGALKEVRQALLAGQAVPYLGPGLLSLGQLGAALDQLVPSTPQELVKRLVAQATVPHKVRNRLTQAAQYIENFKHRKTVVKLMNEAFAQMPDPQAFQRWLASLSLPLIVESWYDDTMAEALRQVLGLSGWGEVQGLSQSEHFGTWHAFYDPTGVRLRQGAGEWPTLLYRPIGGHAPAGNYLVSDADYVEVLTEIDIQTPIPQEVQSRRSGRSFVFIGCRFDDQLTRSFARQIMKRSAERHWAILPDEPTRMEARFLAEQGITRISLPLAESAQVLMSA
jgi:SIR2-like domain